MRLITINQFARRYFVEDSRPAPTLRHWIAEGELPDKYRDLEPNLYRHVSGGYPLQAPTHRTLALDGL